MHLTLRSHCTEHLPKTRWKKNSSKKINHPEMEEKEEICRACSWEPLSGVETSVVSHAILSVKTQWRDRVLCLFTRCATVYSALNMSFV